MDITPEELVQFWERKLTKYIPPSVLKGFFDDNIFFTLEDNRSVFFFILVGNNQSKKLKTKSEIHKVYAIAQNNCEKGSFENGESVWIMHDSPTPISCQRPFNDLHKLFLGLVTDRKSTRSKTSKHKLKKPKL